MLQRALDCERLRQQPEPESEPDSDSDKDSDAISESARAPAPVLEQDPESVESVESVDLESEPTSPIAATAKDLAFLDEPHSPIHKSLTIDSLRNARDNETFSLQKATRADTDDSEQEQEQTEPPSAPRSERSTATSSRADVRIIPFPGMLVNKNKLRRGSVAAVLTRAPRSRAEGAFF